MKNRDDLRNIEDVVDGAPDDHQHGWVNVAVPVATDYRECTFCGAKEPIILGAPLTEAQRDILDHATGGPDGERGYRNRFATAPDCDTWADVQALVDGGFMMRGRQPDGEGGLIFFHVTDAGMGALGRADKDEEDVRGNAKDNTGCDV